MTTACFHSLYILLGYVYIHTLQDVLCTLMSSIHMVIRVTLIPHVHVTLTVLKKLVFKQVMRNEIVDSSKML